MKRLTLDQIKGTLANDWRGVAGKEKPQAIDEFWDVVLSRPDRESREPTGRAKIKVIVSGPVVEVFDYEEGVKTGPKSPGVKVWDPETGELLRYDQKERQMVSTIDPETGYAPGYDPKEAKRHNSRRSKNELRRLILSNFDNKSKFITLTFRDGAIEDVTNVRQANKAFENFIKRLRKRYGGFKYCKVIEFQDANGRGAVHYHMVSNLPYIPADKLNDLWGLGFVGINNIDHVDNVGAYIRKYMVKDFDDARLAGEKAYTTSKNMIRPITLFGEEAAALFEEHLRDKKEVFTNSYESEYQGTITYKEYNLNRT